MTLSSSSGIVALIIVLICCISNAACSTTPLSTPRSLSGYYKQSPSGGNICPFSYSLVSIQHCDSAVLLFPTNSLYSSTGDGVVGTADPKSGGFKFALPTHNATCIASQSSASSAVSSSASAHNHDQNYTHNDEDSDDSVSISLSCLINKYQQCNMQFGCIFGDCAVETPWPSSGAGTYPTVSGSWQVTGGTCAQQPGFATQFGISQCQNMLIVEPNETSQGPNSGAVDHAGNMIVGTFHGSTTTCTGSLSNNNQFNAVCSNFIGLSCNISLAHA